MRAALSHGWEDLQCLSATYGMAFSLTSNLRWCCADTDIVGDSDDVLFHVVLFASKPEAAVVVPPPPPPLLLCNEVDIADGTWAGVAWCRLVTADPVVDPPFWCIIGICSEPSKFKRNAALAVGWAAIGCDGFSACCPDVIWLGDFGEWAFDAICIDGSRVLFDGDKFVDVAKLSCGLPKAMEDECNEFTFVNWNWKSNRINEKQKEKKNKEWVNKIL